MDLLKIYFARQYLEQGIEITYLRSDQVRFCSDHIQVSHNSLLVLQGYNIIHIFGHRHIVLQRIEIIEIAFIVRQCRRVFRIDLRFQAHLVPVEQLFLQFGPRNIVYSGKTGEYGQTDRNADERIRIEIGI